uniref:Uncharacterized protein n=1 Tax=uncultured marine virus TaxID=186617 RepID=A0A0F7L6N1_9VIRU|nr:hypothetical protein [uncultured marine virus]
MRSGPSSRTTNPGRADALISLGVRQGGKLPPRVSSLRGLLPPSLRGRMPPSPRGQTTPDKKHKMKHN